METLGATVKPGRQIFHLCQRSRPRVRRYQISFNGRQLLHPADRRHSVYNELIDFLYLDKTKMKKFDTAKKIDAIADGAAKYEAGL